METYRERDKNGTVLVKFATAYTMRAHVERVDELKKHLRMVQGEMQQQRGEKVPMDKVMIEVLRFYLARRPVQGMRRRAAS
jgi:tetrahydromethanopterin S-methyltransferase subunit G